MTIATFDANVLASGFASRGGLPAELLRRWTDEAFTMALSEHILDETERTFDRPYFRARLSATEKAANLTLLRVRAARVTPDPSVRGVSRDPDDDPVLGTAVAAQADYLVTDDGDLLALGEYQGVRIVSARQFLAVLDAAEGEARGEPQPA